MKIPKVPLTLACFILVTQIASAATNTVTSTADSGAGSLRSVVAGATSGDSILFSPALAGQTIVLTSGEIVLNKNLTIDGSTLTNGLTLDGNGSWRIFNVGSGQTVTLKSLTLRNCHGSGADGGAIDSGGTTTIDRCTFYNNATGTGGAIRNLASGIMKLTQCTFTGNSVPSGGGAIANYGVLLVTNCTISANSGGLGGAIYNESGGQVTLANSIAAGNSGVDLYNVGTFAYSGVNMVQSKVGTITGPTPINAAPLLQALGNYGGLTQTMPPQPGSPAIDAGTNGTSFTTDQRGVPRPIGAFADLGAVEKELAPTVTTLPAATTNTVATLNGTANPNGAATVAWFEWGSASFNYSQQTAPASIGSGTTAQALSAVVSNLTPGLIYHCRLVASNAVGVARGQDVPFGSPSLLLIGSSPVTNECHFAFADPGVTAVTGSPVAISAGDNYALALKSDRTLAGWGTDFFGQLNIPGGLSDVVAVDSGLTHVIALRSDGTVVAWGYGGSGATNIPAGATNVLAIRAGDAHSLALKKDGTVIAWGNNDWGQVSVPAGLSNVVAIAAGNAFSLALEKDGTVVAWGNNDWGQASVPAGLSNVVSIDAGQYHSLALKSNGTVVAWGNNDAGQLNLPPGLSNVVAIAGGYYNSMALKSDGTVVAWGDNSYGETIIPAGLTNVVAISQGTHHSAALKRDGTVVEWGDNTFGQTNVPSTLSTLASIATTSGSVNTNSPGSYVLTYTGTNGLGGVATATRTVIVNDSLPPALTMFGNNLILITNVSNLPFVDPGATAFDLCGGALSVIVSNNVNTSFPGTYTITYRATDATGNTAVTNRTVLVALPPQVPGDQNGDGIVSQSELDAVYANYLPSSPWLALTNVAGLGGTNVTFSLSNSVLGALTVEYTTNFNTWQVLGPATPRYLFTDTNAPVGPQRFYRLRSP